jgi:hemoglobin
VTVAVAASLAMGLGCGPSPRPPPAGPTQVTASLYLRLGGIDALRALVDDAAVRLASDPRIGRRFLATDFVRFKRQLLTALCGLADGPCRTAAGLVDAHRKRGVSSEEAEAWLDDVAAAAAAVDLPSEARAELLERVAGLVAEMSSQPSSAPE